MREKYDVHVQCTCVPYILPQNVCEIYKFTLYMYMCIVYSIFPNFGLGCVGGTHGLLLHTLTHHSSKCCERSLRSSG